MHAPAGLRVHNLTVSADGVNQRLDAPFGDFDGDVFVLTHHARPALPMDGYRVARTASSDAVTHVA
ncbi:hypothetical protein [Kutzneria sp. NPDC052558]|uniref:hypothetical protein n=1 Tax=Kutzneria sp. NPDC052558 TaxID=3364121 RepID=UPI0037CABC2A